MKVKFVHDNGANIHSRRTETFDIEKDLCTTPEEWKAMSEDERMDMVEDWAMQDFNWWYENDDESG